MKIPEIIVKRRSIRSFTSREVTEELAKILVQAACLAPSAGNRQPWEFIIVRDEETKRALADAAYGQSFISKASVIYVVCALPDQSGSRYGWRGRELYCIQDTAAAIQNLILTAVANGLGSCWIGAFDESKASYVMGLPTGVRPVALIPVGYPDESPAPRPRRSLREVVHKDRW
jgi:nitroreductase